MKDRYTGKRVPKSPPRGFVDAHTWTPSTRTHHTIATKTIECHTPAQIIRDAAAIMRPKYKPLRLSLSWSSEGASLTIQFGAEGDTSWECEVRIGHQDIPAIFAHMFQHGAMQGAGMLSGDYHAAAHGDGGEEMTVPTVSESLLQQMQPATAAVN
jgi:hypothetical protein